MNRKQYNRSNSTKNQRRAKEVVDTELSSSNPYTWYANFPNYAKDVATLAFGTPVGQPIYLRSGDYVANAGIMTLGFTPTPGVSTDNTSPINRQAVRFQTYLRSIQRSASTYDAADTMMYMMGIDSLYTYWAYLRRAYGVAQLFTPTNKYYPRRLLQAMGISPDISHNLADFRAYINRFALNIGRFALPKEFDIVKRHMWMCSGLYLDSNTSRAQTYMFVPQYLYQFDNTVTTGSQLTGVAIDNMGNPTTQRTLSELQTLGDQLINAFENDEDTMNISGDIYRAYGKEGCLTVEETPDNYAILPVYDETVSSQIENAVIVGDFEETSSVPLITQDPSVNNGAIIFNPAISAGRNELDTYWTYNYPLTAGLSMMNMHMDSPNHEQVMEGSRFMALAKANFSSSPNKASFNLSTCAADLINQVRIWTTSLSNPAAVQALTKKSNTVWQINSGALVHNDDVDWLALTSQFDWCPMTYIVRSEDALNYDLRLISADVDNFTSLSADQLSNINEAALLSVLDIHEPIVH